VIVLVHCASEVISFHLHQHLVDQLGQQDQLGRQLVGVLHAHVVQGLQVQFHQGLHQLLWWHQQFRHLEQLLM
jgi:hypothetical protein